MRHILLASALMTLTIAGLPGHCLASDGVTEINRASVIAAGGFPATLSAPGSYLLTGDLVVPAGQNGIVIDADDVQLDLNGFSITGPHVCVSGSCSLGTGVGIDRVTASGTGNRVTLIDGRVSGFGEDCVRLGADAHVEGLLVTSCGGDGIELQERGLALSNRVNFCGGHGLNLLDSSAFGNNVLVECGQILGQSVSGGRATVGNICDDFRCRANLARPKYYLTTATVVGGFALTACQAGFHMASMYELWDPSNLEYVSPPGVSFSDLGTGPPASPGWVHTGGATASGSADSAPNCDDWISASPVKYGTVFRYRYSQASASGIPPSRQAFSETCDDAQPVWCIQD